jgi:tetratricopeptide (TPR) repeat protein
MDLSRWLLIAAALALCGEMLMGSKRARTASLALFLSFNLFAQSAGELLVKGNEASRTSRWEDAADFYQAAARERPRSPEVQLDLGTAWYHLKLYSEASQAFERAAKEGRGTPLEIKSRFGLANCVYRQAMEASTPNVALLSRALDLYRQIPLDDAKYNAEIVKRLLARPRPSGQPRIGGEPPSPPPSSDAATIVNQSKIGRAISGRQPVDRDW